MTYLAIKTPELTDEAAVNLQDFFYAVMDAFDEHYYHQTERYYREIVFEPMSDINISSTKDEPPF